VADAMAGVGPFAVPAGKRGCRVFANDLNPDSHKWLVENINLNKVAAAVSPYNLDGREFMTQAAGGKLPVQWAANPKGKKIIGGATGREGVLPAEHLEQAPAFDHMVMNLPATAVEFLDALRGSFDPQFWAHKKLPMVHVYAFLKSNESTDGTRGVLVATLCALPAVRVSKQNTPLLVPFSSTRSSLDE